MKIQLSADELKAIVLKYCQNNLQYEPLDGTIKIVTEEDKGLFAEFEVALNVSEKGKV